MRYAFVFLALLASPALAQQASTTADVREAYGSRLDRPDFQTIGGGATRRLTTRLASRVNNRLDTRVQRYNARAADPAAAYRATPDDGTRRLTIVQAPLPPPE